MENEDYYSHYIPSQIKTFTEKKIKEKLLKVKRKISGNC